MWWRSSDRGTQQHRNLQIWIFPPFPGFEVIDFPDLKELSYSKLVQLHAEMEQLIQVCSFIILLIYWFFLPLHRGSLLKRSRSAFWVNCETLIVEDLKIYLSDLRVFVALLQWLCSLRFLTFSKIQYLPDLWSLIRIWSLISSQVYNESLVDELAHRDELEYEKEMKVINFSYYYHVI